MKKASLTLDRDFLISPVDPRIFGNFTEMLGRCIYTGLYQPGHPMADEQGFRKDVLQLVRELNVPITRFPGGNFVSNYDWTDGIGPVSERKRRLDLAWMTTESNRFGLNEFIDWCKKANTAPMMAVNLGTKGPAEARDIVEYCNHPSGTYWSDLRVRHGYPDPHNIKVWCLGNEMDGPWQTGHKTAVEYGRVANEAAKMMKWVDPSIELVACGSSGSGMPSFGSWELESLTECYENVDYVSLHNYYSNAADDTPEFLASSLTMDAFISRVVSLCDAVAARTKSKKQLNLSFDEWNVWYHSQKETEKIQHSAEKWGEALPILEDIYTFEDALLVGMMLITLMNHSDRVKMACMAQLVNVIAPIMTDKNGGAWKQTIFYPLFEASNQGRGEALRTLLRSEKHSTSGHTDVPMLECAAVRREDDSVALFLANRDLTQDAALTLDLHAFGPLRVQSHSCLHHEDKNAVNTANSQPVHPVSLPVDTETDESGRTVLRVPAFSWNTVILR